MMWPSTYVDRNPRSRLVEGVLLPRRSGCSTFIDPACGEGDVDIEFDGWLAANQAVGSWMDSAEGSSMGTNGSQLAKLQVPELARERYAHVRLSEFEGKQHNPGRDTAGGSRVEFAPRDLAKQPPANMSPHG